MTLLLLLALWSTPALAADPPEVEWEKTFGGSDTDYAYSVQQTTDGGYIIAGITVSYGAGKCDVYLIKTDANGNQLWYKTFGGSDYDYAYFVQQTTDGGYIIAGGTDSYGAGNTNVYLIKTDANGNQQWYKTFGRNGYDYAYSVQQTTDGGYIIAGKTNSYGAGSYDAYLIKTDANGNQQWYKTFGGSDYDYVYSVQQTTDGGYIIAGGTDSYGAGNTNVYLIKTDANGNQQWYKTFWRSGYDYAYSVQQTTDGGYIIAGYTYSYGAGSDDVYLIKTDANGNQQWYKTFGGSYCDRAYSVQQTADGGYIIAGHIRIYSYGASNDDVYLIKTDANGNQQWYKTFGRSGYDYAYSVQKTADGGYIIAGGTDSYGAGNRNVYIIKVGADGNSQVINSITVTPGSLSLIKNEISQLTVTAHKSDGTTEDVTGTATYTTSDATVVTVSGTGLVTAVGAGEATITVTYNDLTATVEVTVFKLENEILPQGDIIILRVPQHLEPVTYDCSAGFTVAENGVSVPVTMVEVKDGTEWPYSEVWLYLEHPVTMGSDVVVSYTPSETCPINPAEQGQVVNIPTGTQVTNYSTTPLTIERSTVTVGESGDVVYIHLPTAVRAVDYNNGAGYVIRYGSSGYTVPVTRVVVSESDPAVARLYLGRTIPAGEPVYVDYSPSASYPIETVTGTPLSGTTGSVSIINDSTAPVIVYDPPAVSEDGRTITIPTGTDMQEVYYEGNAGFRVYVDGREIPVVSVEVQDGKIILTLGAPLVDGQTPVIDYTPDDQQPIQTENGNLLDDMDGVSGGNQSEISVTSLEVAPAAITAEEGAVVELTVTAHYSDGTSATVTAFAGYSNGNSGIATVEQNGRVTAVSAGNTTITVTYEGKSINVPVTVTAAIEPVLENITVTPASVNLVASESRQLTVTAHYSDGSIQNVTRDAGYTSSDSSIASVTSGGMIEGVSQGNAVVTISYGTRVATVQVTVSSPAVYLEEITVTPDTVTLDPGETQQLTVTAFKSDGSTEDVTAAAGYQSTRPSVAAVENGGVVTAIDRGFVHIVVTYGGKSFTVPVTVNAPPVVVVDISVQPEVVVLPKGNFTRLKVIETYSNGTVKDVTQSSGFSSKDTSVATVDSTGLVTGVDAGETEVVVTYQDNTINVPVTVAVQTVQRPSRGGDSTSPVVITQPQRPGSNTNPGTVVPPGDRTGGTSPGTVVVPPGDRTGGSNPGTVIPPNDRETGDTINVEPVDRQGDDYDIPVNRKTR